jgi:CRP-like cAMP-binding protein
MLISSGEVKMTLPLQGQAPVHLATLGAGHMFGEMSFLEQQPHSAEVRAVTPTELIGLDRAAFDRAFADHPDIVARVMTRVARSIAHRLRHNNNEIQEFRLV